MPEQQPEKRCGTCEHYDYQRCWVNLPPPLQRLVDLDKDNVVDEDDVCGFWTPKPPKNPEEK